MDISLLKVKDISEYYVVYFAFPLNKEDQLLHVLPHGSHDIHYIYRPEHLLQVNVMKHYPS